MFLGFYPEMGDQQNIAWIGTILSETALVWHLQPFCELKGNDTWVNYTAAIQAEYHSEREAADTQLKLGQLRYQGSICTFLMEFRALNNFARATGEGLREKIDLAMPDSILDMQFNQNSDEPTDNKGFMNATYQAGIQVEKKKALRMAREMSDTGIASKDDKKKEGQNKGSSDGVQKGSGGRRVDSQSKTVKEGSHPHKNQDIRNEYGGKEHGPQKARHSRESHLVRRGSTSEQGAATAGEEAAIRKSSAMLQQL